MSTCIKCGSEDGIVGVCQKCCDKAGSIPRSLAQFTLLLIGAGWVARNDAQHRHIAGVWAIIKEGMTA